MDLGEEEEHELEDDYDEDEDLEDEDDDDSCSDQVIKRVTRLFMTVYLRLLALMFSFRAEFVIDSYFVFFSTRAPQLLHLLAIINGSMVAEFVIAAIVKFLVMECLQLLLPHVIIMK